jgi:hypothetical protein
MPSACRGGVTFCVLIARLSQVVAGVRQRATSVQGASEWKRSTRLDVGQAAVGDTDKSSLHNRRACRSLHNAQTVC